jgi:hypothetical protein
MKLLKINDTTYINPSQVEALEIIDQLTTRVYMSTGKSYKAMLPLDILISFLETKDETMKNLNAMAKTSGYFAG